MQIYTHAHTCVFRACVVFFMVALLDMQTKSSPTVATVSVAQMSGLLQLHLNRSAPSCTALAPQAGIGLDGGLGLGCRASERASKAVELLRRQVSLSLSLSLSLAHSLSTGLLSTFKFLLTGSPRQFQSRQPTPPPQTRLRHLSLPLSPLTVTSSNASTDKLQYSASHFSSTSPFVLSTHRWDGPCSQFSDPFEPVLIDRFLVRSRHCAPYLDHPHSWRPTSSRNNKLAHLPSCLPARLPVPSSTEPNQKHGVVLDLTHSPATKPPFRVPVLCIPGH